MLGVVEIAAEPEEPFEGRDADDAADDEGDEATFGLVGAVGEDVRLYGLRGEVTEEVDDQSAFKLCEERAASLHGGVCSEGDFDGLHPRPVCAGEDFGRGCLFGSGVCGGRSIAGCIRRFRGFPSRAVLWRILVEVALNGLVESAEG